MLMARLKEETRSAHDRLEREPLSRGLVSAALSPHYYAMVLEVYYGLYAPIEARLSAAIDWPAHRFDLDRRLKTPLLRADLAFLGREAADLAALPICDSLPWVPDLSAALGCMYVLEGSTLGGQLIARHVGATLGYTPTAGGAFFNSYGPEVGALWKSFKLFVDEHGAGHEDGVIAAASAMFACLENWFSEGYKAFTAKEAPVPSLAVAVN